MSTGLTNFERLTQRQIDAAAATLWDFTWNHDPNDPNIGKQLFEEAGKSGKDNYREWARAILLAAETGEVQHTWNGDFPRAQHPANTAARSLS